MSFFSGMAIGFYRYTRDGRRVCGLQILPGFSRTWYLVSDDDAVSIEHRFRQFWILTSCTLIPTVVLWSFERVWLLFLIVLIWPPIGMRLWVLRGIPRTVVKNEDLEPIDGSAELAQVQEMGEARLWVLFFAALAMGALAVTLLLSDGVWWAWLGLVMFGACAVAMARGILMVRRARRRSSTA